MSDTTTANLSLLAREHLLDRAVHAGVINSGMRAHYARAYDADPAGCRAFLGKLGLRDEAATTTQSPAADEYDESLLTPTERARVAAAREGKPHGRFIAGG